MGPDDSPTLRDPPTARAGMAPAADAVSAVPDDRNPHARAFRRTTRAAAATTIRTRTHASGGGTGTGRVSRDEAAIGGADGSGEDRAGHLVDRVVALMSLGLDVEDCSRRLGMPADLIDLAARHARAEGRLPAPPTTLPCGPGSCRPDPSSLLCAGCPLAPSSDRGVLAATAGGALRRMRIEASRLMRGRGA
ncbi:hypothetical protein [uncultured Bifidobacterium sp.]|uniref:hypothetical protein n=1 Tax=uncultured Bifidobacterium sp. TaxID=165187 RepID=UPI0028DB3B8C|nr:hypothetical protein [uncultured Bifidobacterium sp.]